MWIDRLPLAGVRHSLSPIVEMTGRSRGRLAPAASGGVCRRWRPANDTGRLASQGMRSSAGEADSHRRHGPLPGRGGRGGPGARPECRPELPAASGAAKSARATGVARTNPEGPVMQVDGATVRRIARLARIRIADAEARALERELSGILDWVEQLDAVDTSGVEPMTRVIPMTLKKRADRVTDGGIAEDIVSNAPAREDHFFAVPKVVE
jgi:aspartyl-tRNA(Asn)/glutamyl-tRNA(Gln) amidotransferase subunit C